MSFRLRDKSMASFNSVMGIYDSISETLEGSKPDGNLEEIKDKLSEIQEALDTVEWGCQLIPLNIQLSSHVDVIKSSMTTLHHYLNNPYSAHFRQDFIEQAKSLQNSLTRILERLVMPEISEECYLDVMKNHTEVSSIMIPNLYIRP